MEPIALPTNWVTAESLTSFAGMVTVIFIMLITIDLIGVPEPYWRVLGLSGSLLLNVIVSVLQPVLLPINVVLALVNGMLTFIVAWLAFKAAEPLRTKYRI